MDFNSTKEYIIIRREQAALIMNNIINSLKELDVHGVVVYNGNSISIQDNYGALSIWIRLLWKNDLTKCNICISTVNFIPELQRKGYFTKVINNLKKCKYTENITIQSVCTEEMRNWCKKHRFKPNEMGIDYFWKA